MGYVPPKSAAALIREDLAPDLYRLYVTFATGSEFLGHQTRPTTLPRTYAEYVSQLYGHPGKDWFTVINYTVLAAMVAFVVMVGWVLIFR